MEEIKYSTSDFDQPLKRKVDCFDICALKNSNSSQPDIVAVCDEQGVLQINNFNSGHLLLSLTTIRNKGPLSKIYLIPQMGNTKLYMVTAYTDGKIMFYKQPNIHLDKDNQPENVADTILNSNVHKGEIYAICSNEEFIAIGGLDNKVSFWKIITG